MVTGADCAEDFDVSSTYNIESGTVVVLDQDGAVERSHKAYDKKVAGNKQYCRKDLCNLNLAIVK